MASRTRSARPSLTGFTLIELLVVIAIIAILAAVVAPNAFRAIEKAKAAKAVSDFKAIKNACYALYADTGRWPINSDTAIAVGDSAVIKDAAQWPGWDGPYLERDPGPHPWGGLYVFDSKVDWGGQPAHELFLSLDDSCAGGAGPTCDVPATSMGKIDAAVDDGDLGTGEVRLRAYANRTLLYWVVVWDAI